MKEGDMEKKKAIIYFKNNGFRGGLLISILFLIFVHLSDTFIYPKAQILPPGFLLCIVIVQLFFLWLDEANEKYRILRIQKEKQKLDEIKIKFSILTTHELMTPIAVFQACVDLMKSKGFSAPSEEFKDVLGVMNKYLARLKGVKDNLNKFHSGIFQSPKDKLIMSSIEEIIKSSVDNVMLFIKKRNQKLTIEIDKGVPCLPIDKDRISQALTNLLLNSIRFTPDKGRIIIRVKEKEFNLQVEVEDNGIGIPKDRLETIFESFYEAQDSYHHKSGTIEFKSGGIGLGLAITKNIIDLHEGKIWAESEEGKFSRFTFILPKEQIVSAVN